jgi:putative transposase
MHVKLQGQEYSIAQRLSDGQIQLKHIATGTLSAKSDHDIVRALFEGVAELVGNNGEAAKLEARREWTGVNDFEALEDGDPRKTEALRRLGYVKAARKSGLTNFGKNAKNLKPVIEKVSKTIKDPKPPTCITVSRWHKTYTAAGDDIRALAPAFKARGKVSDNDGRRISDDLETCETVERIVDEVVKEHYLSLTRPTAQSTYDLIEARIRQENQFRDNGDKLPIPHRNTLYRIINKLDPTKRIKLASANALLSFGIRLTSKASAQLALWSELKWMTRNSTCLLSTKKRISQSAVHG